MPELASRDHIRRLVPLIRQACEFGGASLREVGAIAFTEGPGLGGALLTGAGLAAGLGLVLGIPLIAIHHLEGHLLSPLMSGEDISPPYVALLVSGGHTQLMLVSGVGQYTLLGETIDDAAGEAFDKTAMLLGLSYPGGPALAKLAETGIPYQFKLPKPLLHSGNLDFSFSGLKTAVANLVKQERHPDGTLSDTCRANIAASFQAAVVDVLVHKCRDALRTSSAQTLVVAGGVGANAELRRRLQEEARIHGDQVCFPPPHLCTDNGAMIAHAAALRWKAGIANIRNAREGFNVRPRWPL